MRLKHFIATFAFYFFITNSFAANYYWVGGSGYWSDIKHWATSSGGSLNYLQVPTPTDNVYFDSKSFLTSKDTVNVNVGNAVCRDMDWTGATNTPSFLSTNNFRVYGSLKLIPAMNWLLNASLYFEATSTGKTITTTSNVLLGEVIFNGIGGEWILQDSLLLLPTKISGNFLPMMGLARLSLNNGHLNTNGKYLYCGQFASNVQNIRQLTITNSTLKINSNWQVDGSNLTLNAQPSLILANSFNHNGEKKTYFDVYFENFGNFSSNLCTYHTVRFKNTINGYSGSGNKFDSLLIDKGMTEPWFGIGINADTAKVFISRTNINIGSNSKFGLANIYDKATIKGSNTYDTLLLNPGGYYILASNGTQLINHSLVASGICTANITIESGTSGTKATISKSSGTVNFNYVSLKDINATGGATFIANNSANLGNNSGWTINSAASLKLYWVGGAGNWNDPIHWATSSGGAGGSCLPTANDDVYFDSKSFLTSKDTVNVNVGNAVCRDMDWTGATNTPSFLSTNNFRVYGSLKLIPAMNWLLNASLYFEATSTGKTITTTSNVLLGEVIFNGIGGEWILQDSLLLLPTKISGNFLPMMGSARLSLNHGHLNTNGKYLYCGQLNSNVQNTRQLTITNSTLKVNSNWQVDGSNLTLNAQPSLILANSFNHNGEKKTYFDVYFENFGNFSSNLCTYHTVRFKNTINGYSGSGNKFDSLLIDKGMTEPWFGIGINADTAKVFISRTNINIGSNSKFGLANIYDKATIKGSNTYDTLLLNPGGYYILASNGTQLINHSLVASGICTANITIESGTSGTKATISKSSGTVNFNYVSLKDINATGGATFIANNSANLGNNSGWTINSAASLKLYWVGGAGNWNDPIHWATSSGGAGGSCLPTANDDVYFDSKSFLTSKDTVNVNVGNAVCRDMDWTGATNTPSFLSTNNFRVYGSLKLIPAMNWLLNASLYFEATSTGKTITTTSNVLLGEVIFNGIGGEWILQDSLLLLPTKISGNFLPMMGSARLSLNHGHLNTNGKYLYCGQLNSNVQNTRQLTITNSTLKVNSNWQVDGSNLTLNAQPSLILANSFNHNGEKKTYFDVYFENFGNFSSNLCTYHTVRFKNTINGYSGSGNKFDSLLIDKGMTEPWFGIGINADTAKVFISRTNINIGSNSKFGLANIYDKATIKGSNTYDTLLLNPGGYYYLGAGFTQTINDSIRIRGNGCFPITLQSTTAGIQSSITYSKVKIVGDYIEMRDQKANGGAQFYAGSFSTNVSNNTGWIFNNAPDYVYGLGKDTTFCGTLIPFNLTTDNFNGGIAWRWQDGSTAPTFYVTKVGKYYVDVAYAATCYIADTINISVTPVTILNPTIKIETDKTTICQGVSTTFTAIATDTGELPIYQWKLNGINVGSNSTKFSSSTLQNSDIIKCIITTNNSCNTAVSATSNNISITVITTTPPSVSITASATNICIGTTIDFTTNPINAGESPTYQWQINGNAINEHNANFSTNSLANNDAVSVIMTSSTTCALANTSNSNIITITVNNKTIPTVSFTSPVSPICSGTSSTFTAIPINGGTNPIYQWKLNGQNTATTEKYTTSSINNNDILLVELTSSNTCVTTNTAISTATTLFVTPKLTPSINITASTPTICAGASITYSATIANGGSTPSYQWKINNINVGVNNNTFTSTTINNNDVINVTLLSNLSCVTQQNAISNSITAIVNPLVSTTVKINPSATIICKGDQVNFSLTSTNEGDKPTYQWKVNNTIVSTNATFSSTSLSNNDVVSILLTSNAPCLINSTASDNVTINLPTLNKPIVSNGTIGDYSIEFIWNTIQGATSYQISIDGGVNYTTPSSGSTGTKHLVANLAPDFPVTILVKAIGIIPCVTNISNPYTARTTINKVVFVPNAFTPNGDGNNDLFIVNGTIKEMQIKIYNQWGVIIFTSNSQSNSWDGTKDNIPQPAGPYSYYLEAILREGNKITQKGNFTLLR